MTGVQTCALPICVQRRHRRAVAAARSVQGRDGGQARLQDQGRDQVSRQQERELSAQELVQPDAGELRALRMARGEHAAAQLLFKA